MGGVIGMRKHYSVKNVFMALNPHHKLINVHYMERDSEGEHQGHLISIPNYKYSPLLKLIVSHLALKLD